MNNNKKAKQLKLINTINIQRLQFLNDLSIFYKRINTRTRSKNKLINKIIYFRKLIFTRNIFKLIHRAIFASFLKKKLTSERIINDIKNILIEKTDIIERMESDNIKLKKHYHDLLSNTKSVSKENETLKNTITTLETKIETDNVKFKELYTHNINDINILQETLKRNEDLLSEAIKREEKLQHKYCIDIQNAIKLNKKMNTIIRDKNQAVIYNNIDNRC